jgi:signal transduction histidine kinase
MNEQSKPGSILVVDDTIANLRLLADLLKGQNYKVRSVTSGAMALMAASAAPPDVILLDINMPEMDGYEVCRQLKKNSPLKDIPVIVISALDDVFDKVKAFDSGAVDYITKPIEPEEVLARVSNHLQIYRLRSQLQERTLELEQGIQELDAFAHTVAHDLRNPLTSIIGYAEMLKRELKPGTEISERAVKRIQSIAQAGRKMNAIIEALLLLANVSQQRQIHLTPINMADVIAQVQNRLTLMIEEYQGVIKLSSNWPRAVSYVPWLEEVWANYLSNGLKYGGRPPVLELGADRVERYFIRFWVRDNGPGLDEEAQLKLFTPFTRLHQDHTEGHGLGLSIVQRIVERLGGRVGVESSPGKGSMFYFTLPETDGSDSRAKPEV